MTDLLAFLESADLPEEVKATLRQLQPTPLPHGDTLVTRLSLLRTFTERTFAAAAAGLDGAPAFTSFVTIPQITPLVGYPGRFAVAEKTRWERLAQWTTDRAGCQKLAEKFLEVLDPQDAVERLDRLQVAFMADQHTARAALKRACESTDAANDIPGCSALVQIAAPAIRLFGDTDSTQLLNQMRSRSQARNLFFAEFYQTSRYFARVIDVDLRAFVQRWDDRWILHVHAPGGMGKTTMLRRLIAHEWIRGSRPLPCAWLDFDYLDVATVVQHPALLGLAMAAQWNEQLEQPVFGGFLLPTFQPLASLLFRNRGDASARTLSSERLNARARTQYRAGLSNPMRCGMLAGAVPPRTPEERTERLSQTPILRSYWNDKLPDAMASMPADRPIVLVLDTLEDASLQHGDQLLDTLRLIATLRRQARKLAEATGRPPINLRLILSGRHRLGVEHIPEFKSEFAGQYDEYPLKGLADPEARVFLDQEIEPDKHLAHRPALIDAMIGKSQGIPFNLSLFAEWANEDSALSPAVVDQSEDVSTVMLIERIVRRIPYQPLRWIVRYGSVPRTLSLEYLREVMGEPLIEALSGGAASSGLDKPESDAEQDVWNRETGFEFDADVLWTEKLLPYVSERSWIMPGESAHEVAFRSDILQPMRRLLQSQRIFQHLHERSRAWFAERAKDPGQWVSASTERLYHTLQLATVSTSRRQDFVPRFREFLDTPPLAGDAALRAVVCRELRGPDFALLRAEEKAYLQYRLAEALAVQQGYAYVHPEAVQALGGAIELAAGAPGGLPAFAALWNDAVKGVSVSSLVGGFSGLPHDDRLRFALLISEVAERGSKTADGLLESALTTAQSLPSPAIPVSVIAERLAIGRADTAAESAFAPFRIAAEDYGKRGDHIGRSNMLQRESEVHLGLGRITRAIAALAPASGRVLTPAVQLQLARIELAKGNPGVALQILATVEASGGEQTELLLLRAEALSQRLLFDEAEDAWEHADQAAAERADSGRLAAAAVGRARFYHTRLKTTPEGTPGVVQHMLRRTQHVGASVQSSGRAGATLGPPAEVEIWQMLYGPPDPDRWQRRAMGELGGESPTARIRLMFALSQVVSPFPVMRWNELLTEVKRLPRSARAATLTDPVLAGDGAGLPVDLRAAIAEAFVNHKPEGEIESAWYGVRYGELLVWLGHVETAVEVLEKHVPVLSRSKGSQGWVAAAYRERRRIEQRIRDRQRGDGRPLFPAPAPDPPELWAEFWSHTPLRAALALVENARRASDAGAFDLMARCLDRAEPELQKVTFETAFHVAARELRTMAAPPLTGTMGTVGPPSRMPRPEGVALAGAPLSVLEIREQSGRITVRRAPMDGDLLISAENKTLEVLVRSRGIPRRLAGLPLAGIVSDLTEFTAQVWDGPGERRLALKLPLSPLTCAPWELSVQDALRPIRLPTNWTETSAASEADLAIHRPYPDSATPLVPLLIQPMSPLDRESPAVNAYLALRSYFPGQPDQAGTGGLGEGVDVLYFACSFIEIPHLNEPALAGLEWTASALVHRISTGQYGRGFRPVVVLDVPIPVTSSDLVHQLLLRNYFAQALIDSGTIGCVLATGLHEEAAMAEIHRTFLPRPSATSGPRAEVYDRLAELGRADRLLPHDALFTASPYLPFLAGTRPHA